MSGSDGAEKTLADVLPPGLPLERAVIGVTGNPGSGKSTVSRWFAERGAVVVDADAVGHELLQAGSPVHAELIERFGREIESADGGIDRKKLGPIVFGDPERLRQLNEIVHPRLLERIRRRVEAFRSSGERGPMIVDAALLFEWDAAGRFDAVVTVEAPVDTRRRRFEAARGGGPEAFGRIEAAQLDQSEKVRRADLVIRNGGDLNALRQTLNSIIAE